MPTQLHQFITFPIDQLKLAEYNPRTIDEDNEKALKKSLTADPDFLYDNPIVVNTYPGREGVVYIGNQRVKAAQALGWQEVPVLLSSVDELTEKRRNIQANHHNGQFDEGLLRDVLIDIHQTGFDMSGLGFTPLELTDAMSFDSVDLGATDDPEYGGTAGAKTKEHTCPNCGHVFTDQDTKDA